MEKTDKSLAELEIESQKWAFSRITEAGAALTPLRGPGFVGLKNLGNSCYMVRRQALSAPPAASARWRLSSTSTPDS